MNDLFKQLGEAYYAQRTNGGEGEPAEAAARGETSGTAGPPGKHGRGIPPPQTRGRSRGAPPGTPDGPRPPPRPASRAPGSRHRGPRSDRSHKPDDASTTIALVILSVHPPARSRSGRPARPHRGTLSQGQAARPRATQTRSWAPVTTRHTGAGGEPTRGGGGHAPDGTPRAHTHRPPAATSQPAGTPGPGPAGSSPDSEGGGAGHSRRRAALGHHRGGRRKPSLSPANPVEGEGEEGPLRASRYGSAPITEADTEAAVRGIRYPKARLSDR